MEIPLSLHYMCATAFIRIDYEQNLESIIQYTPIELFCQLWIFA